MFGWPASCVNTTSLSMQPCQEWCMMGVPAGRGREGTVLEPSVLDAQGFVAKVTCKSMQLNNTRFKRWSYHEPNEDFAYVIGKRSQSFLIFSACSYQVCSHTTQPSWRCGISRSVGEYAHIGLWIDAGSDESWLRIDQSCPRRPVHIGIQELTGVILW